MKLDVLLMSHRSWRLCSFFPPYHFSSPLFGFYNFYWSIFKFIDCFMLSLFCYSCSRDVYMILSFLISIPSSLYLLFLYWDFLFLTFAAKILEIAHWGIFIITTLKSLSDNSDVCIISTLISIDCLFPSNIPSYSYAILNSILKNFFSFWTFWTLFKFHVECLCFCCSKKNYSG